MRAATQLTYFVSGIGEEGSRCSGAAPSLRDSPTVNPALPSETSHPTTLIQAVMRLRRIVGSEC